MDALFADLYEFTMLQAYLGEGMEAEAVFTLSVRHLPEARNYLVACGLGPVLEQLEAFRFTDADIDYLATLGLFDAAFLARLKGFRFEGDVYAMPEGTPVFADEPILEVVASLPQGQLVETLIMNQIHVQTLIASKAARMVAAAAGRPVIDFGARRMHGADAADLGARAAFIAGAGATSNVRAAQRFGIPPIGTMAHSYIQAHETERTAFEAFARRYPGATLLVDTIDTLQGVKAAIELMRGGVRPIEVTAVRLDSGDLAALSAAARQMLDEAGFADVRIVASGGLDEYQIAGLVARGAPIDTYCVGTRMGVSSDAPYLDITYKLAEYAGRGRVKLSTGKPVLPGRKQVFRTEQAGMAVGDVIGSWDEPQPGRPLLRKVMGKGRILAGARTTMADARRTCADECARLPAALRSLEPAPYPVSVSPGLERARAAARREAQEAVTAPDAGAG